MKRNKFWMTAIAVCALTLSSCGGAKLATAEQMDGEWNIEGINGKPLTVTDGQRPFIGFDAQEGRVYGYGGCNWLMAGFDTKTGEFDFSKMGSTMMAGPNMEMERDVLNALGQARGFVLGKGGMASLCDANGKQVVELSRRFEAMDFSALRGDWRIVSVNGQAVTASEEGVPALSFDVEEMRLGGTTGCNRVMGQITRDAANPLSISFGQPATTRMACPDMTLERDILAALGQVRSFGKLPSGHVALFSAGGMMAFELAPMR